MCAARAGVTRIIKFRRVRTHRLRHEQKRLYHFEFSASNLNERLRACARDVALARDGTLTHTANCDGERKNI